MEWQSFFIGMGVMMVLMAVVFALIPSRRKPDVQMKILHGFWRENIRISLENQEAFESIAESLSSRDYKALNIIFDGPPGPTGGRFVEVETDDGKSINAGEWIERRDDLWALRIAKLPKKDKP